MPSAQFDGIIDYFNSKVTTDLIGEVCDLLSLLAMVADEGRVIKSAI